MPTKKKDIKDDDVSTDLTLPRAIEERLMNDQDLDFVIGVDEAGRGPLAGPVVAGACVFLTPKIKISGINDSKQVDEETREKLYEILSNRKENDVIWGIGEVDNHRIDEINVLQGTFEAMTLAVENVIKQLQSHVKFNKKKILNFHILIDGNKVPPQLASRFNCTAVIKGDGKEFIIGAASVFAKVTRDRIMYKLHDEFPMYNFGQHKGYGTASHFQLVHKYGPCKYHRFTFAPIKHMNLSFKNNKIIKTVVKEEEIKKPDSKKRKKSESGLTKSKRSPPSVTKGLNKKECVMSGLRRSARLN